MSESLSRDACQMYLKYVNCRLDYQYFGRYLVARQGLMRQYFQLCNLAKATKYLLFLLQWLSDSLLYNCLNASSAFFSAASPFQPADEQKWASQSSWSYTQFFHTFYQLSLGLSSQLSGFSGFSGFLSSITTLLKSYLFKIQDDRFFLTNQSLTSTIIQRNTKISTLRKQIQDYQKLSTSTIFLKNKIIQQMGDSQRLPTLVLGFIIFLVFFGTINNTLCDKFQNKQSVVEGGQSKTFYHPHANICHVCWHDTLLADYLDSQKDQTRTLCLEIKRGCRARKDYESQEKNIHQVRLRRYRCNRLSQYQPQLHFGFCLPNDERWVDCYHLSLLNNLSKNQTKTTPNLRNTTCSSGNHDCRPLKCPLLFIRYNHQQHCKSVLIKEEQIIGYILIIGALFLNGFCFNFEQHVLKTYHIEPLELISYQSISCLCAIIVLISAFTFVPCSFGRTACVLTDNGSYFQRPEVYFSQLGENKPLLIVIVLELFSVFFFNICAINITKHINALARAVCDVIRTVIIWIVGIIVTLTVGQQDNTYNWQLTSSGAISLQLVGFLFIIAGNLFYNRIISLPFFDKTNLEEGLIETTDNSQISI